LNTIDSISKYTEVVCFFIITIFVLVTAEVVARYVFNSPTAWSQIATQFIFGGYFVIGGAYCLLVDGHIKVDIVYAKLSLRKRAIIDTITSVFFFGFVIVLLLQGAERSWVATTRNETTGLAWDVIKWPYMWTLPIASFLLALQGIAKLIRDLMIIFGGEQEL
jgi:TRAP-type mannitol/chloroaromatic compound transport system permease small subunit